MSIINNLTADHYVFYPSSTQTASITIWTAGGGLVNPLISVISFLLSLFNASAAAYKAGNALLSYVLASS